MAGATLTTRFLQTTGAPDQDHRWMAEPGHSIQDVQVRAADLLMIAPRWQAVAVLTGVTILLLLLAGAIRRRGKPRQARSRWRVVLPTSVALIMIGIGLTGLWALPVPELPRPPGPYDIGTTVREWTDPTRPETATPDPDDRRMVVVQLWYPAEPVQPDAERARYLGRDDQEANTITRGLADYLGVPAVLLDGLPRARGNAVQDAPVASSGGPFPVVLFSPGLGGIRTQNTAWAEDLASRGYVVAALDHPYDSAAVVLRDGRTIRTKVTAAGDDAEDERRANGWTDVRAADLRFVLDQLELLNRDSGGGPPAGQLNTKRAAATGHSLGGAAALQAARQDHRFDAVIDLDGFPRNPASTPFPQPVLAVAHPLDLGESPNYLPRLAQVLKLSSAEGCLLTVPGTEHLTFTDVPLFLPPLPSLVGTLGRRQGPQLTSSISAVFLDATLKADSDPGAQLSRYGDLSCHRSGRPLPR